MKAFVSHSYFTDELLTKSLYASLGNKGVECYDHQELSKRLKVIYASGPDLDDLINAYRRGGRPAPTQECSAPGLHELLVDEISKQDALIILWSEQYSQKFWPQREMSTALSRGIPLVVLALDDFPLEEHLMRGVRSGRIPRFEFRDSSCGDDVCEAILNTAIPAPVGEPSRVVDEGLNRHFLQLEHPMLGALEISESYFTWRDFRRFLDMEDGGGSRFCQVGNRPPFAPR